MRLSPPIRTSLTALLAVAGSAAALALCGMFVAANMMSTQFLHPDEIAAHVQASFIGVLQAVYFYWGHLYGRVSALFYLFAQDRIIDALHIGPWIGTVAARGFNHLLVLTAFVYAVRAVLPRASRTAAIAFGALALAAAFALAAQHVSPYTGATPINGTWQVDQSIYFLTAAAYVAVAAAAWGHVRDGLSLPAQVAFAALFFVYLSAHEINLVVGGLLLAALTVANATPPPKAPRRPGARWAFPALLAAVYAVSAAIQVFAPSVRIRGEGDWASAMPLFPDAFLVGAKAGGMVFLQFLDARAPILPLLLAVAILAGRAYGGAAVDAVRCRWAAAALVALLVVYAFVTSTLSAYTSVLGPDQLLPPHQIVFIDMLGTFTVIAAGSLLGASWPQRAVAPRALPLASVVLFAVVATAPGTRATLSFVSHRAPFDGYARMDRQLRAPDAAGVAHVDEWRIFRPGEEPSYVQFFTAQGSGLQVLYKLGAIVWTPCMMGPHPNVCGGRGGQPTYERVRARGEAQSRLWTASQGLTTETSKAGVWLGETAGHAEHFIETRRFANGLQAAIRVAIEIEAPDRHYVAVSVNGPETSAVQYFDLIGAAPGLARDYGARVLAPRI